MEIKTVSCGVVRSNCYIITSGENAVVIDPGYMEKELKDFAASGKRKIGYILLTHRHFDHICAASELKHLTGAKIAVSAADECGLYSDDANLTDICCGAYGHVKSDERADVILSDGDSVVLGDMKFNVLETPGHSKGGLCFLCGSHLFSGDTLFAGTTGRTDLPGGSLDELMSSLKKLLLLPPDTVVFPGHGKPTTIGEELLSNPFLRGIK